MKASIHISTKMIRIISYTKARSRIITKDYLTYPLPDECVLNGVILDSSPIIEGLRSIKSSNPKLFKDVSLVIDGSFVYAKKITVPGKLNKFMRDGVIRDEFADISTDSANLICDYHPLSNNADGSKEILACAVENTHVQAYLSVFAASEIKLASVHLGILTVLHFVKNKPEISNTDCVLNIVDDMVLLSMIFHNGVNVFQSRSRLYGDNRTELVSSTLDGFSGIIQFDKSQSFEDITTCYYLGLSDADMDFIAMNTSYPEITFLPLHIYKDENDAGLLPPDAHFTYLNAHIPHTQSDLLSNMKMLKKIAQRSRPKKIWIPILAGIVLPLAAVIVFLMMTVSDVMQEIQEINNYMYSPATIAEKVEIDALIAEAAYVDNLNQTVVSFKDEVAAEPHISRQILDTITGVGANTITIDSINFSSASGIISVSASCANERDAARYVEALSANALIDSVNYTGFSAAGEGVFVFAIDVIAAGWREGVP